MLSLPELSPRYFFHQCNGDNSVHGVEANVEEIRVPDSVAWYKCEELVAAGAGGI